MRGFGKHQFGRLKIEQEVLLNPTPRAMVIGRGSAVPFAVKAPTNNEHLHVY